MDSVKLLEDLIVHLCALTVVLLEEYLKLLNDHEDLGAHHLLLVL